MSRFYYHDPAATAGFSEKEDKINYFLENSELPANLMDPAKLRLVLDADGTDEQEFLRLQRIRQNAKIFVDQGENLFLHSSTVGCGKTSWSAKIRLAYFLQAWHGEYRCAGLFIPVSLYLNGLKNKFSGSSGNDDEYIQRIERQVFTADLVIWDDLSAGIKNSDFDINRLYTIINTRLANGLSNIYTSNLGPKELYMTLGDRLASRIYETSIDIELHGQDKRSLIKQQ